MHSLSLAVFLMFGMEPLPFVIFDGMAEVRLLFLKLGLLELFMHTFTSSSAPK
jgi:hypothetical protein